MFESLVSQVAGRFGLTDEKTKQLLGMLIGLVFNQNRGGPAAFLQSFRDKGLGDVVASWLGNGENLPINGSQISNVLGADIISSFGNKLGLPGAAVSDASAALLPTAISTLAHDGNLDVSAWDRAKGWFGNLIDGVDDKIGAAAATVGAVGATAAASVGRDRDTTTTTRTTTSYDNDRKGGGGWWKWLLPLLAILLAIWLFRSCSDKEATAPVTDPATTQAADPAAATQAESKVAFSFADGKITASGTVESEASKKAIIDALTAQYGAGNVVDQITVDASVKAPSWLDQLKAFLPNFKSNGATLTLEGNKVDLSGNVSDADKASLLDKIKAAFGGFTFGGLLGGAADAVEAAELKAKEALAALKPDASAEDYAKALDLIPVQFDTDKATIKKDSDDILTEAANTIKKMKAGTKIEIGGYTDSDGDDAHNLKLSQERADSVKARLESLGVAAGSLTAKGFGEANPKASNDTEEGKAQNRRIEYKVQ